MNLFWQRLSSIQQTQILVLFSALILAGYLLWFKTIYQDNVKLEQQISRRENRLASRANPLSAVQNSSTAEKDIKALEKALALEKRSLQRIRQRFVPLDNPEQQQRLRRELSELASGLGMRIIKLEGAMRRSKNDTLQNAPDFNEQSEIDPRYGRPLVIFEAWGNYFALQTLLDDLNSLSFIIAPVNLRITADERPMNPQQALQVQQILHIQLVLAI